MKPIAFILGAAIAMTATHAMAQDLGKGGWLDLTHSFNKDAIYWPTAEKFQKTEVFHGHTQGGWFYSAYNFSAAEHGGTHMDSPIHFAEGAHTADQVPVDQMIGPGCVIDVTRQAAANVDYLVSTEDIVAFEAAHGRIPEGAIVLLNTGRAKLYPDAATYMGTAECGADAVPKLHFPGLSAEAAAMLVERKIGAVGIDTPYIDYGQSKDFAAHVELMSPTGATIVALPMKIEGGSGSPLRIVADIPGN